MHGEGGEDIEKSELPRAARPDDRADPQWQSENTRQKRKLRQLEERDLFEK